MPYFHNLQRRIAEINSVVCVGLDTDPGKIPACLKQAVVAEFTGRFKLDDEGHPDHERGEQALHAAISSSLDAEVIFRFNKGVVDATLQYAAVYKLNYGFYLGEAGATVLRRTVGYLHSMGALCILDFKSSDIGNSAEQYANYAYNDLGVDAVTVNPFLGHTDSLDRFTRRTDKGVYVLCATSNGKDDPDGATLFQELRVKRNDDDEVLLSLSEEVGLAVARWNKDRGNLGLVVGATRPEVFMELRQWVGEDIGMLIPAFGEQKGAIEQPVKYGCSTGVNAVGNISRQVLYGAKGEDRSAFTVEEYFAAVGEAARRWRDTFNQFRPVPAEVAP